MVIYIYISHRKLCAFSKDKSKQNLLPTWQLKLVLPFRCSEGVFVLTQCQLDPEEALSD